MNEKLNIQDLVDLLAEKHGMDKKNADSFVREFFLLLEESLEKDKYVKIKGLGTFKLIDAENRENMGVCTEERLEMQGHAQVSFIPESSLKEMINKPFSHFDTVVLNENTVLEDTVPENGKEDGESKSKNETSPILEETEGAKEEIKESEKAEVAAKEDFEPERAHSIKKETADSSAMKFFIGIVVFVVVLCGGAVLFMYYMDLQTMMPSKPAVEENDVPLARKPANETAPAESLAIKDVAEPAKSAASTESPSQATAGKQDFPKQNAPRPVPEREQKKTSGAVVPDSVSYAIVGTEATYIIKEGETLVKVALRFYGTKTLWPYLVKYNPDVIKDPNNVLFGTAIKIPKLSKKQ